MRIRCELFGCREDEHCCCARCDSHIYEGFIVQGRLTPLFDRVIVWWRSFVELIRGKKCWHCGKRIREAVHDDFCSRDCYDRWIPF